MSGKFTRPEGSSAPLLFSGPMQRTLDRMRRQRPLAPETLTARASQLLVERFGASEYSPVEAFAHGTTGLLGEQTHYTKGFAVLLPLAQGAAVAVRPAEGACSRLAFEGRSRTWSFDRAAREPAQRDEGWPAEVCLVEETVRRGIPEDTQVEVAVVSTVPASCFDAYLSALGVAGERALRLLAPQPEGVEAADLPAVRALLAHCTHLPFSVAYPIAASAGSPPAFTLVDTATQEHLPVEAPPRDVLGWGLVDLEEGPTRDRAFHRRRRTMAREALARLREHGFAGLPSFRELEHRDLQRALDALPPALKPIARHLVTENRRVQKLVAATRRKDWQMLGALLLMSHSSLRDDWQSTSAPLDFVVKAAEDMSMEGIYGACMTGRGGCALVVGQAFSIPDALDHVAASFERRYGRVPRTLLL